MSNTITVPYAELPHTESPHDLNAIEITISTSSDIHEDWKSKLTAEKTVNELPKYTFAMEFPFNMHKDTIVALNDITPKAIVKRNKHPALRSVARQSPDSMFYYNMLDIISRVDELNAVIALSGCRVGVMGGELQSAQLLFKQRNDTATVAVVGMVAGVFTTPATIPTTATKYNLITAGYTHNANCSDVVKDSIQNTDMVVNTLTALTALEPNGVFISQITYTFNLVSKLITIISNYFNNIKVLQTPDGSLFLVCIKFTTNSQQADINKLLSKITSGLSSQVCSYIQDIKGIIPDAKIIKIMQSIKRINLNTDVGSGSSGSNNTAANIRDLLNKINNTIAFLKENNIPISMYYEDKHIPADIQYYLDNK